MKTYYGEAADKWLEDAREAFEDDRACVDMAPNGVVCISIRPKPMPTPEDRIAELEKRNAERAQEIEALNAEQRRCELRDRYASELRRAQDRARYTGRHWDASGPVRMTLDDGPYASDDRWHFTVHMGAPDGDRPYRTNPGASSDAR